LLVSSLKLVQLVFQILEFLACFGEFTPGGEVLIVGQIPGSLTNKSGSIRVDCPGWAGSCELA
jgi:hypothetical protein